MFAKIELFSIIMPELKEISLSRHLPKEERKMTVPKIRYLL
jgi:hypothetical protein